MSRLCHLADRVQRGLGRAGRAMGADCGLFRPDGPGDPLAPSHRIMTLPAAFAPESGNWARPVGYGQALWQGLFDASYTRAGDYLLRPASRPGAGDGGVWFVAGRPPMLPPLCVRASRVVGLSRAANTLAAGVTGYGAAEAGTTLLIAGWPASLLDSGTGGTAQADLPTGTTLASWAVLLPVLPGVMLRTGDLLADDLGRSGVVATAELSELGWRLHVKQTAT
jgi:hypothetical protein